MKKNIKDISAISNIELNRILYDFNNTTVDYPKDKCVHQLFEEQVTKTPNKTAVSACDKMLTYKALNEEANKIAHSLIARGVKQGDIVAFMLPRRSYLIATMFGILKSGAAYMPIDPNYPQDRIEYMLSDSGARLCITEENINDLLNNSCTDNPNIAINSENLCYCIYTSGSTGKPKGTLLTHGNVVNYVNNNNNNVVHRIIKDSYRNIVSITTVGFDIFVTESLLPLTNGMEVLLANEEQSKLQSKLNDLIKSNPADVIQTTPTKMKSLIADKTQLDYLNEVKVIILGGEALDSSFVEELKKLTDAEIFNIYGPTEATVWATNGNVNSFLNPYDYFYKVAMCKKQKIALSDRNTVLSYSQLNGLINGYCAKLQTIGIKKGDIVAIHLNRSIELVVFQLAVLKAGAIFLPVDKRYPIDRIEYMCKDCNVSLLISDTLYKLENSEVITLKCFKEIESHTEAITVRNKNVCYIIYTSGSTGTPKGCMLKGSSLVNFCKNNNTLKTLRQKEDNIFACVNSVSFDYFIAESMLPLLNGYQTVILDDIESTNQRQFLEVVGNKKINVLMTTPTRLKLFFDDKENCDILQQLDCICTSGETLPEDLLRILYKKSPKAKVYNPLGPSECTVWNVGGELEKEKGIDIHIGKPIANTQIYIVDKYIQPTPIGVTGELCIAGDGVGAGYLNRPELTAEKFIDNPFGKGKLYKTGDLAYWRKDGNIVYVGRNDFQVKIRGLRIELGEIENAISSVDSVSQSVVIVRKDETGRQLICAFYTEKEPIDLSDIKKAISKKLPKYMMPHIFTKINEMPLTSSGKVNRKALPEVDLHNISNDVEYVAPKTPMQKALCELLADTLKIERVGIADDFFDIGCDSLKAIEFISSAHSDGIYFPLQYVFDYPTVEKLCDAVNQDNTEKVKYNMEDFEEIHQMLQSNKVNDYTAEKIDMGDILLAGSTGFLGMHILAEYLECEQGKAYCLARRTNLEQAKKRFTDTLEYYFDNKYTDLIGNRIIVICGDIEKENLGLDTIPQVETFINAAASVKHYGSYAYFKSINTQGVINAMNAAKNVNARFIHISTLSVSGNGMVDAFDGYRSKEAKTFSEKDLYIEQSLDNVYIRSKFEGECAVYREMLNGMKANVIRVGNLTNRASDMKFQPNYQSNAFLARVKAVLDMGAVPDYLMDLYSEFSPVDDTARGIIKIAQHFNDVHTVFHLNSHKVVYFNKFVEYARRLNIKMEVKDEKSFATLLAELGKNDSTKYIYEALINDLNENEHLNYDSNIHIENKYTLDYLAKLGFDWSEIDFEYIKRYVEYFREIGYLK